MDDRVIDGTKALATAIERLLALGILVGSLYFAFHSTFALLEMDWRSVDTYYELIYRVLLIVIGVELIRTLVTHDLMAILELIAFVVARKMLKPDLTSFDIFIGAIAFALLMIVRRYLLLAHTSVEKEEDGRSGADAAAGG